MKVGQKRTVPGLSQGYPKMVPGAPVGIWVGSLGVPGGSYGKRHKKGGKRGSSGNRQQKKIQKNWLLGAVPSAAQKWKDKEGVIKPWLLKVV